MSQYYQTTKCTALAVSFSCDYPDYAIISISDLLETSAIACLTKPLATLLILEHTHRRRSIPGHYFVVYTDSKKPSYFQGGRTRTSSTQIGREIKHAAPSIFTHARED